MRPFSQPWRFTVRRRALGLVLALGAACVAGSSSCSTSVDRPRTPVEQLTAVEVASAIAQLHQLPVKGRAAKSGYGRQAFGPAWSDDVDVVGGHNGCDTRNDQLGRDLVDVTHKTGTRACVVLTGRLTDPYTGAAVLFRRGPAPATIHIDHVVALGDAWQKGAQQLTPARRRDLANDPLNLQATTPRANLSKGDQDAASWLPPARGMRCAYVARQIAVKVRYGLWVTKAEQSAMAHVLTTCLPWLNVLH